MADELSDEDVQNFIPDEFREDPFPMHSGVCRICGDEFCNFSGHCLKAEYRRLT